MNTPIRAKTSIPVPEVYSYNSSPANDIGASYMIMDHINGAVASELQDTKDCAIGMFGTVEQDRKFREQMAGIQAQLSSFTFDKIGSLYQDQATSEFVIGPEVETGKGPWSSSTDYYNDLADHVLRECVSIAEVDAQENPSFVLPIIFKHLVSLYGIQSCVRGPFRLTNRDFGSHNLLINDDFEIVGVIDFDGVMAAPIEVAAQYPTLTGLDRGAPGNVPDHPAVIERLERIQPQLEEYKELLKIAESRFVVEGSTPIADLLMSDAASVFQGLLTYRGHQSFANDKWLEAYAKLLRKHIKSGREAHE